MLKRIGRYCLQVLLPALGIAICFGLGAVLPDPAGLIFTVFGYFPLIHLLERNAEYKRVEKKFEELVEETRDEDR